VRQADAFYIVVSGTLGVHADGTRVMSLGVGDCFGEMGILNNVPRNATVVADTPVACLSLAAADLRRLLTKSSALRQGLRTVASDREENLRVHHDGTQQRRWADAGGESALADSS